MKRKFNIIKKSRKKSKDIDEKIEYLNKECQKTDLNEITMSTSGIYQGTTSNPNSGYAEITAKNFNGVPFAMSGDSNLGQGSFGGASIRASDGAALSPDGTTTQTKGDLGSGGFKLAIPGERQSPSHRMTGPIMWYWTGSSWGSLEYNSAAVHGNQPYPYGGDNAGWGYWGSNFMGFPLLRSDGAPFASLFNTIDNFDPKDSVPKTIVFTKDDLGDPGFLPIDVAKRFIAGLLGLAGEGLEYLGIAAADPIGSLTKMGTMGLLQLGSLLQGAFGVEKVNQGMVNAMRQLLDHHNNNNPLHPDFRKHDPSSPNYEGPKPLDMDKKTSEEITERLDTAISNLNGGNGPTNPNGNLTSDEITQVSDEMNKPYVNGDRDPASFTFYNALHSLPPNTTNFSVKDGKFDKFDTNYVFSDPRDANPLGGKLPDKLGNFISNVVHGVTDQAVGNFVGGLGGGEPFYQYSVDDPKYGRGPNNKVIGTQYNTQTSFTRPPTLNESYITEGVKLGHFDPEALTVNIEDIRKGIMPEFPKDPPPEMINGYSAKSRLAPKVVKGESFIKVTKKDLAALHILKDSEIKELLQQIDLINAYLKNNPTDLIYAQQRYPKDDIRLAQLNWKMDQMKAASDEYMDTHFPENKRLFNKLQDKIIRNVKQTDPKNFTGHKEAPKFTDDNLEMNEQKKKTVLKYFKKPVKNNKTNRIQRHVNMKEVKKKNIEEVNARNLKEKRIENKNQILKSAYEKQKSDWKEELKEFTGWQAVAGEGPTNATSQTFGYFDGGFPVPNSETGQQVTTTASGLGGVEVQPSVVNLDLGFGETMPVNPPTYDQLALAGYAKPILMKRRDTEDVNPRLDASQEFAQNVGADVNMNARVDYEDEQEKKAAKIIYNAIKLLPRTRFNQELKVLYGYLSGEMTEKITNEFISKKHLTSLFKTAGMRGDGRVQMDDFIVGSGQKLTYDPNTDTYSMKFNYDFETNAQELLNTKLPLMKRLLLPIIGGKYGYDAGIFGRMVERAKQLGFGQNIEGEFTISGEDLYKTNPKLIELYNTHPAYMNDMGGFDTGHGHTSPPAWLDSWARKTEFTGDLRSLWNNKTRTWNLGGKIVDNDGNPINKPLSKQPDRTGYGVDEFGNKLDSSGYGMDPARDSETEARPFKPSKAVKKIKSMAKTKRQLLSLDEPFVRAKGKKKEKG